jgi:DNA-binding response OmpR family regulator
MRTDVTYDGTTALTLAKSGMYDAIVLDFMLPGMSGLDVVRETRRAGISTPVLMLTARTSTSDKVDGLDAGADDYMTKPFEAPELLARLRALTRRQGEVVLDEATFADLTLDLSTHDLRCGDKSVHLSGKEFEVLSMLMSSNARIVSKQDLLTRVWGADGETSENSVEAYVSFLRKKLTHLKSEVHITTLRMLGYRLEVYADPTKS